MNKDTKLIFENYIATKAISEDVNDQYAPEEAPTDDQLGEIESTEEEEDHTKEIAKSLQEIVSELKTLNQYADFISTGTRTKGFAGEVRR